MPLLPCIRLVTIMLCLVTMTGFVQADNSGPANKTPAKVLIVVTSHSELGTTGKKTGYFLSEVTHPYYVLTKAGYQVDIASPKGGLPPMDERSHKLSDEDNKRFVETATDWRKMENSILLSSIDAGNYRAIIFAGGHGTMWDFPDSTEIQNLTREIYESGGVVAAVCHGPAALVNVILSDGSYLVAGREVSTFTNMEERIVRLYSQMPFLLETVLKERGAKIEKSLPFMKKVTVDGRLVTGQNPNSARELGIQVVNLLNSESR
jgi:putative intracellular protease/amidase